MTADPQTLHAEMFAELGDAIDRDRELIVEAWLAQVAAERPETDPAYRQVMQDRMPSFLRALAMGLRRADSADRGPHRLSAVEHGEQRWTIGWRLADVVRDYQTLRIVLVEHLSATLLRPLSVREVMAIGLLLDEAIAAAVVMFVAHEERQLADAERQRRDKRDEELLRYAGQLEKLNRSLAGLSAQAAAANQAKSEFLAKMSHDIRSPLTAVLGYVELLAMQLSNSEHLHALQTIQRNAHFLVDILNDVLDLSRIEAGKLAVEPADLSPAEVVSVVVELMSLRAAEKGIGLTASVAPEVPATIVSDSRRLKQILINLVVNAIKFTAQGEVRITVALDSLRRELTFTVADTGVGMSADELSGVFEPFSQGTAGTAQERGSGLGLTISKHLAELLGGQIAAESCLGEGSTFRLILPLERSSTLIQPEIAASSCDTISRLPGPCRILVADDQLDHRAVIAQFLIGLGARVDTVESGRLAVDSIVAASRQGDAYDLVLMDMRMADLDGQQATHLIRAAGIDVPIIALTASVMPGDQEQCLAAGCNEVLSKPIDFGLLSERVAHYVFRSAAN